MSASDGDFYIDDLNDNFYLHESGAWVLKGNISPNRAERVPLVIASGVTFRVPDNTQVLYGVQIHIQAGGQIYTAGTGTLKWDN